MTRPTVPCPTCHSPAGSPCFNLATGDSVDYIHEARSEALERSLAWRSDPRDPGPPSLPGLIFLGFVAVALMIWVGYLLVLAAAA